MFYQNVTPLPLKSDNISIRHIVLCFALGVLGGSIAFVFRLATDFCTKTLIRRCKTSPVYGALFGLASGFIHWRLAAKTVFWQSWRRKSRSHFCQFRQKLREKDLFTDLTIGTFAKNCHLFCQKRSL